MLNVWSHAWTNVVSWIRVVIGSFVVWQYIGRMQRRNSGLVIAKSPGLITEGVIEVELIVVQMMGHGDVTIFWREVADQKWIFDFQGSH